jgi:hypothetical protein
MLTLNRRIKHLFLFGTLLASAWFANWGCEEFFPESTFKLATDSRLPRWVTLAPGLTRANTSLQLSYYVKPWGSIAQFVLLDGKGQILQKENGRNKCSIQSNNRSTQSSSGYPAYEVISVNGITEIDEHKKMEPIFYVTDDPAVWKQYESSGCK